MLLASRRFRMFGHVLHIALTEHNILHMIIVSIILYVPRSEGQRKLCFSTQILSDAELVHHRQFCEVGVIERTQASHRFGQFAHYGLPFSDQGLKRSGLTTIHSIVFFHLLAACIGSCFHRRPPHFLLIQV